MKTRRIGLAIILLAIISGTLILTTVASATEAPDSTPTVTDVRANINLLEDGDVLIYGLYNIPYATLPDDDAGHTYIFRLLTLDGLTQLGAIRPFPYAVLDNGYNQGAFGFYFSASDNLTTDEAYIIRISQNPAYFGSPQSYDYTLPVPSWTSATTQEHNQAELVSTMISLAEDLEIAYGDVTLLETSVGGTILSDPTGETYFRGAIYGIQAMAPELFLMQSLAWDTSDRDWELTNFDSYGERWSGTFIGTASDNTSATFGLETTTFMGLFFLLPIIIGYTIISHVKFRKAEPGYLACTLILILFVLMGWISATLFATTYQLLAMYIGYLWFYSRTGEDFGPKMFSFLAFVWITSTMICLIIEGSWFGATENTVINDLSIMNTFKIGGLAPLPVPSLYFFRGIFRILLWDYSFYTGDLAFLRYIWLVVFSGAAVWGITKQFVPVIANFLKFW